MLRAKHFASELRPQPDTDRAERQSLQSGTGGEKTKPESHLIAFMRIGREGPLIGTILNPRGYPPALWLAVASAAIHMAACLSLLRLEPPRGC